MKSMMTTVLLPLWMACCCQGLTVDYLDATGRPRLQFRADFAALLSNSKLPARPQSPSEREALLQRNVRDFESLLKPSRKAERLAFFSNLLAVSSFNSVSSGAALSTLERLDHDILALDGPSLLEASLEASKGTIAGEYQMATHSSTVGAVGSIISGLTDTVCGVIDICTLGVSTPVTGGVQTGVGAATGLASTTTSILDKDKTDANKINDVVDSGVKGIGNAAINFIPASGVVTGPMKIGQGIGSLLGYDMRVVKVVEKAPKSLEKASWARMLAKQVLSGVYERVLMKFKYECASMSDQERSMLDARGLTRGLVCTPQPHSVEVKG